MPKKGTKMNRKTLLMLKCSFLVPSSLVTRLALRPRCLVSKQYKTEPLTKTKSEQLLIQNSDPFNNNPSK